MSNIRLTNARVSDKIRITDEKLLQAIPKLKERTLIVSVIKRSGQRIFCQYFSPETGCGTLKVTYDPNIEIIGKEEIITLSTLLRTEKYSQKRPTSVTININGSISEYNLNADFWEQNYNNIRLKHLIKGLSNYSVPGSSIVKSFSRISN
jgi:phosphopentomutase